MEANNMELYGCSYRIGSSSEHLCALVPDAVFALRVMGQIRRKLEANISEKVTTRIVRVQVDLREVPDGRTPA